MSYSLYTKGRVLGHKRGKRNSRPNQSLVAIEGVDSKEAARAYLGKVGFLMRRGGGHGRMRTKMSERERLGVWGVAAGLGGWG